MTTNEILLRSCEYESRLIEYLQPERHKDEVRTNGGRTDNQKTED